MSTLYTVLPGTASQAYSEALDQSLNREHNGVGTGFLFISKTISGRKYWYLRHKLGSAKPKTYYLGADKPELLAAIERQTTLWDQGKEDARTLERAIAVAVAAGCMAINHRTYKVLSAVAQAGYFRAGGALVGSYAFIAAANMLGVS